MSILHRLIIVAALLLSASGALAQVNNAPKPDVVGANGLPAPQVLSMDPQISMAVFDSTGVTVTSATTTTFADATHFPVTLLRGATTATQASGFQVLHRNGLYRVDIAGNCTGVTTETGEIVAQISLDGGSTWTQIAGAQARSKFLTGILQVNLTGTGYVSVSQTSTALGTNNIVIALRGSSSGGSAMTCANGGGLFVQRVDQLQPATYP